MCQSQYCFRYSTGTFCPAVALLFHSQNTASTSYLALIQIYNTQKLRFLSLSLSLSHTPTHRTHAHTHTQSVDFLATDADALSLSNSLLVPAAAPANGPTSLKKKNTQQNVIQFLSHGWLCLELSFKAPPFWDVTVKCQAIGGNFSLRLNYEGTYQTARCHRIRNIHMSVNKTKQRFGRGCGPVVRQTA